MSTLYVVRCNFAATQSLAAWEQWYSTEKQDWLLSRPGFLAGQRFSATDSTDGVRFLALYVLQSPAALETPEYRSGWGWGNWRPHIVDWSRDLLDGVDPQTFLTAEGELLRAVFVASAGQIDAAAAARPGLTWARAGAGLDGTLAAAGLGRVAAEPAGPLEAAEGWAEGVFRPASPARYSEPARAR